MNSIQWQDNEQCVAAGQSVSSTQWCRSQYVLGGSQWAAHNEEAVSELYIVAGQSMSSM